MRIKTITSQVRRDFYAIYECEHCGHKQRGTGYDDTYFHQHVVPAMECHSCGKHAVDASDARTPGYPDGQIV